MTSSTAAPTATGPGAPRSDTMRRGDLIRRNLRTDRTWRWILLLGLVGLVLRVAWVVYAARAPVGLYDPARYYGIAGNISHGHGYTELFRVTADGRLAQGQASAYYPPGYPYFLGVLATLTRFHVIPGSLAMATGVVQAFLGAASAVLLGVIGRRVWSDRAGVLAAGVMALYPNLVMHVAAILSETLCIFLVLCAVALVVTSRSAPTTRRLLLVGVVLGLAVLVRSVVLPMVPALFVAWWLQTRRPADALRRTGLVLGAMVLVIVPWTVRNAIRMHAFVPIATNDGDNLCIGYEPHATGVFGASDACRVSVEQMSGSAAEVRHDRETTSKALRFARQDPGRLPGLVVRRAQGLFDRDDDAIRAVQSYGMASFIPAGRERVLRDAANGAWALVGVGGGLGLLLLAWRGRRDRWVVVLGGLSLVVAPLSTFADPRFKVPFVPFLCLGLAVLVARLTGSSSERPAAVAEASTG